MAYKISDACISCGACAAECPVDIELPDHVSRENVHLSDSLHSLAYHMNRANKLKEEKAEKAKKKSESKTK